MILFLLLIVLALPHQAQAQTNFALTVQVAIGEEVFPVAGYSQEELAAFPQQEAYYSSIDAAGSPVIVKARGISLTELWRQLGIDSGDVLHLRLQAADGWSAEYDAAAYWHDSRYYYPDIISKYDPLTADAGPEFELGAEENKSTVAPMLAWQSCLVKEMEQLATGQLVSTDGIRFCFGQTEISDSAVLRYGKYINALTLTLSESTTYTPPTGLDFSAYEAEVPAGNAGLAEEIENRGIPAAGLTIAVGYFGGPYYTKKYFSLADMESLPQVRQAYTFIDNMPAVVLDSAVGVRLTDVLQAAGIDVNSVEAFHFYCSDVTTSWYTSINKDFLLDTTRYYYPNLPQRWDDDTGTSLPGAREGAEVVDTILALKDNWRRFATEDNFDELTSSTRFRLVFGQTDTETRTAPRSAKWIHTIQVMLGGTAPKGIVAEASVLQLEVGSRHQIQLDFGPREQTTDTRVAWTSSEPERVHVDSGGRISVLREGRTVITATTVVGGLTTSIIVNPNEEDLERLAQQKEDAQEDFPVALTDETETPGSDGGVYEIDAGAMPTAIVPGEPRQENPAAGVQNWRVFEMSETAVELPVIAYATLHPAYIISLILILFLGGVVGRVYIFYREV